MESLLSSVLLSLSTNLDNLAIGVAYGVRQFTITWPANLLIALLSGFSTLTSMSAGDWVTRFLPPGMAQVLGSGLLVAMGVWGLWGALSSRFGEEGEGQGLASGIGGEATIEEEITSDRISLREALILGLALTVTNLGTGIGAGMAQLDVSLTSSLSFASSLLTIGGGFFLGKFFSSWRSGSRLDVVAALLLVGLGLYEYFFQ